MSDTTDALLNRVRALEAQVKELCEATGTPFRLERPDVPPEVRALIEDGKRIQAVKLYMELTGADLGEASRIVAEF
jgi:hypothetical protein